MIELDKSQLEAYEKFKEFLGSGINNFILKGYAGTGKTTILNEIIEVIGNEGKTPVCICYTGKAASNMMEKTGFDCFTIHKVIYEYENMKNAPEFFNSTLEEQAALTAAQELTSILECDFLIIDEYSLLTKKIVDDVLNFNKKVLWCGDEGQLEPINDDPIKLGEYLKDDVIEVELKTIHRQEKGCSILDLAYDVRIGRIHLQEVKNDGLTITRRDIEKYKFTSESLKNTVILCWKNNTRYKINTMIRNKLKVKGSLPNPGENMVVLRNNYDYELFNGQQLTIVEVGDEQECYGLKYITCRVQLNNGYPFPIDIWTNPFYRKNNLKYNFELSDFYKGDNNHIKKTIWDQYKKLVHLDFGYCMTIHKSQGSQWDNVILIKKDLYGYKGQLNRMLYTAVTRASKNLLVTI